MGIKHEEHVSHQVDDKFIQATPTVFSSREIDDTPSKFSQAEVHVRPKARDPFAKTFIRFQLTHEERDQLYDLASSLSHESRTRVDVSKIIRATLGALFDCTADLLDLVQTQGLPKRPKNTNSVALRKYDELFAKVVKKAIREGGE